MKNDAYAYLLGMLEMKYGDLEDKRGCYVYNEETGENEWLSVATIARLIERADEEYMD